MKGDKMRLGYILKLLVFISLIALLCGCSYIQRLDQSKYDQSKEGIVLGKLLVGGGFGHSLSFYTTDTWRIYKVNCNVKPWRHESFSDVNYRKSYFNGGYNGGYMVTALPPGKYLLQYRIEFVGACCGQEPFMKFFDVEAGKLTYLGVYKPLLDRSVGGVHDERKTISVRFIEMRMPKDYEKDLAWFKRNFPAIPSQIPIIDESQKIPDKHDKYPLPILPAVKK